MIAGGTNFNTGIAPPAKRAGRPLPRASTHSSRNCIAQHTATPTIGAAYDCSNPSTVWPSIVQIVIRIVKYQSAKSRSFGLRFG